MAEVVGFTRVEGVRDLHDSENEIANDAAALNLQLLSGALPASKGQAEKVQIVAQVANIKSAGEAAVAEGDRPVGIANVVRAFPGGDMLENHLELGERIAQRNHDALDEQGLVQVRVAARLVDPEDRTVEASQLADEVRRVAKRLYHPEQLLTVVVERVSDGAATVTLALLTLSAPSQFPRAAVTE